MFFTDIMLFYFIPLLISVVLYSLIGKMLLSKSKSKFPGGGTRNSLSASAAQKTNQSRIQVCFLFSNSHIILLSAFICFKVANNTLIQYPSLSKSGQAYPLHMLVLQNLLNNARISCYNGIHLENFISLRFRRFFSSAFLLLLLYVRHYNIIRHKCTV